MQVQRGSTDLDVGDAWNAVSSTGTVDTDDDDNSANYQRLQWRNVLTTPVTITLGKTPTITLAFDTDGYNRICWKLRNSSTLYE